MKYAILFSGALAGLALAAPGLVVIGYFLLIIPGLVLTFAPTGFVYLAATALIRRLLPINSSGCSTVAAFGIAILLGCVVMQPFRIVAMREHHAQQLPDVVPKHAIQLHGCVRLEMPDDRGAPECDYLCLALLDSPDVESVSVATAGKSRKGDEQPSAAYTLVTEDDHSPAGLFPHDPGQIVREYPPLAQANGGRRLRTATKAVEAEWAMRLAGHERLRMIDPVQAIEADWVVRIENRTDHRTFAIRQITIIDSLGATHFRRCYRKQAVPARMFHFGFNANFSFGNLSNASFHIGRQQLESGTKSMQPKAALLSAIQWVQPPCDRKSLTLLREQVITSLGDPAATEAQLDLAKRYLGLFFFDAAESDHLLIARIVANDRVKDIDEQIENVYSKGKTPLTMRDAYAQRIVMSHSSNRLRKYLAERLAGLPPGTFANPTADHLKIWNTPDIYRHAAPFIESLADLDPQQAMPALEAALDHALTMDDRLDRRRIIQGICAAFIRLGPKANTAEPRIRELFLRRPSPILTNSKDADQWRFALARMGVTVENLPFFPNQSAHAVRQISHRVNDKLQRYERNQRFHHEG